MNTSTHLVMWTCLNKSVNKMWRMSVSQVAQMRQMRELLITYLGNRTCKLIQKGS
jgi:hypothetical protein